MLRTRAILSRMFDGRIKIELLTDMRNGTGLLILALSTLLPHASWAQSSATYPTKPVRIIVPSSIGSGQDTVARFIAQPLSERLGQQIVVDNRAGAAGMIGSELAARSLPDGYNLLIVPAAFAINPSLYKKIPYDALRDFAPVILATHSYGVLVVHPTLPAKSVQELIALARARPGELLFASSGVGSTTHFNMELFLLLTSTRMVHVPYKGPAPGVIDLVSGRVSVMIAGPPPVMGHVRSGRLRALGVTTAARTELLPDLPTIAESGVPGYESTAWTGVMAPAATSREIVMRLNAEMNAVLRTESVKTRLANEGHEVVASSPENFAAYIRAETIKWAKVVKSAGITAE